MRRHVNWRPWLTAVDMGRQQSREDLACDSKSKDSWNPRACQVKEPGGQDLTGYSPWLSKKSSSWAVTFKILVHPHGLLGASWRPTFSFSWAVRPGGRPVNSCSPTAHERENVEGAHGQFHGKISWGPRAVVRGRKRHDRPPPRSFHRNWGGCSTGLLFHSRFPVQRLAGL